MFRIRIVVLMVLLLREAALLVARQWVFKPLTQDAVKVKSIAILTFTFALP